MFKKVMTPVADNVELTPRATAPAEEAQPAPAQTEAQIEAPIASEGIDDQPLATARESSQSAGENTPSSTAAREFLDRIGLVEKMSAIRILNNELRQEHPQLDEIYKTIEASPDLSKRFLKFANSPWFNSRVQVDSPVMAFSRFGTEGFYRLVLATFIQDGIGELSTKFRIWPHLEWSARAAEMVARELGPKFTDKVFAAAILHDAVVPPMERELQDYLYFLECALSVDPVVTGLESACHGFDHAQAAAELAKALNFEASVVHAVTAHHTESMGSIPAGDSRAVAGLLFTTIRALAIARGQKKNPFETTNEKTLLREIANALSVSTGRVVNVITDAADALNLPAV